MKFSRACNPTGDSSLVSFQLAKLPAASRFQAQQVLWSMSLILTLLTAGCASLPDVGPFVDATNQLRSAVASSGATVEAELRMIPAENAAADQLARQWAARNQAFAAMADYANSIQAIVDAGNKGAESAQKVADSVKAFAGAAGVALPGSPEAVALATDVAKFVYNQIALAHAAKSLEKSMEAAQPAIESIATLLTSDLKDLDDILQAANKSVELDFRNEFSDQISYRNHLRNLIINRAVNPNDEGNLASQVQLSQLLEATNAWYGEYLEGREKIANRLRTRRALIHAAVRSPQDWAVAHGQIVAALKAGRPVNTQSLVQAAIEIRELIRKVREL